MKNIIKKALCTLGLHNLPSPTQKVDQEAVACIWCHTTFLADHSTHTMERKEANV